MLNVTASEQTMQNMTNLVGEMSKNGNKRNTKPVLVPHTSTQPRHARLTNGIFTVTRNPMYVGMVAILIGTALLLNDLWPWFMIALFWLLIRIGFVRHEETLMEQTFGEQYVKYKARVRRWL